MINAMNQLLYPWERHLLPIVQEAGWELRPIWMGGENLAPTGIRSPNCPAHNVLKQTA